MEILFVISAIINIFFNGFALGYFIIYMRCLQILVHVILFPLMVSGNVSMVFDIMMEIVMYDILDSEWTTELFLEFNY